MQITSDDEEFEDLTATDNEIPTQNVMVVQSEIRKLQNENNKYKVQILEDENIELGIVENQYYFVRVLKNGKPLSGNETIKRRFSDFDMLFEIIFRNYKGKILPGFPEKGIVSYMKTKVTYVKDKKYLKERIKMVERFMTDLLNRPQFNCEVCEECRKFLSEKEFDMFKKSEKEKSEGMISSSWNKLKNIIKIGKENKYKCVSEKMVEDKKNFQTLYNMAKTTLNLLEEEEKEYISYSNAKLEFDKYSEYCQRGNKITKKQKQNTIKMEELVFDLYCENEDYLMALKIIENIEEFRNTEENCKELKKVEDNFRNQQGRFEQQKKKSFEELKSRLIAILQQIQTVDRDF